MKKILSLILCVVMLAATVVTASAQSVAKFNITLVSETDSEAVITLDFDGGTGFSGLDFDMTVDSKKVKVVSAEKGAGFANFEKQAGAAFALINTQITPVKATIATLNAFRVVEGKDLFKITLKKLTKDKLDSDDVVINITNCVDAAQQPVTTSLTTDLQGSASDGTTTSAPNTPADKTEPLSSQSVQSTEGAEDEITFTNAVEPDAEEIPMDENADSGETVGADGEDGKKDFTSIIIAVVAVVIVGAAAVIVVVIKKKKSDIGE